MLLSKLISACTSDEQSLLHALVLCRVEPHVMGHSRDWACNSEPQQELLSSMSCPLCSQFILSSHRVFSLSLVVLSEIRSHLHPIFVDFLFAPRSHKRRFLICNRTFSVSILQCCVTYCCYLTRNWWTSDNFLACFGKRFDVFSC